MAARELASLERRGWEALSGPDGESFYADLMADDGYMVFPGLVLGREETLRAVKQAAPWSAFELSDLRVVEAAPDSAVVIYRALARRDDTAPYRALMSSAYVRRDGRWRLILHQQTPDPGS
jgi:uncharacterized protein (TIGR02246 family)